MSRDTSIVPSLMFHSVGLQAHPWVWSNIAESLESFERKIALLAEAGFQGIFWSELYQHMAGERRLPRNSIMLTFDDGYLDNWVLVYPVLRKFGMKATIFVSPDFVDPGIAPRPNLDDVSAGRCDRDDLRIAGFLSWAEMREMLASGLVDIQSHAMSHTWYFSGPKVVSYHAPDPVDQHPWLAWNARPDRKPYYLAENQQILVPWGYPILEHDKSLTVRRYFVDEGAASEVVDLVATLGGESYFSRRDWYSELHRAVASRFPGHTLPGRFETPEERERRVRHELAESKRQIEANLGNDVSFVCWPGGASDQFVQDIARSVGYRSWTLSSRSQQAKRNRPGEDPGTIKRMGTSNVIEVGGRRVGLAGPRYFRWRVLEHQGSGVHGLAVKLRKATSFLASGGGRR